MDNCPTSSYGHGYRSQEEVESCSFPRVLPNQPVILSPETRQHPSYVYFEERKQEYSRQLLSTRPIRDAGSIHNWSITHAYAYTHTHTHTHTEKGSSYKYPDIFSLSLWKYIGEILWKLTQSMLSSLIITLLTRWGSWSKSRFALSSHIGTDWPKPFVRSRVTLRKAPCFCLKKYL